MGIGDFMTTRPSLKPSEHLLLLRAMGRFVDWCEYQRKVAKTDAEVALRGSELKEAVALAAKLQGERK